jgi:hypothetical protein
MEKDFEELLEELISTSRLYESSFDGYKYDNELFLKVLDNKESLIKYYEETKCTMCDY